MMRLWMCGNDLELVESCLGRNHASMLGDRPLSGFILVPHGHGTKFAVLWLYFSAPVTEKLLILLVGYVCCMENTVMPLHTNGVSGHALHSVFPAKGKYVYTGSHVKKERGGGERERHHKFRFIILIRRFAWISTFPQNCVERYRKKVE